MIREPLQKCSKVIIVCEEPLKIDIEVIILQGGPLTGRVNPLQK
ncbi:hypothetical protein [Lysinibacillus irui]|nr:hypothetical protein [Lysinibacillus irui]MEA0563737.1 hypothetical protein [Lysinibacillus irui]